MGRHIISTEYEKPLLKKMADITGLRASSKNNFPKLLFTQSLPFSEKNCQILHGSYKILVRSLPEKNWKETEFNLLKVHTHPDISDVICQVPEKRDGSCDFLILSFVYYQVYKDLLLTGGLPLHGGLIELDNKGVIIAGSSGTGKSTCCSRIPKPWNSICDDEVMIMPQLKSDYNVHPVPTWSEYLFNPDSKKTWDVENGFSFSALFFLEKADTDASVLLGQGRAAVKIYQSAMESFSRYFPYILEIDQKKIRVIVFESACDIAKKVPAFKLSVSEFGSFWNNIEHEINKLN